MRIFLALPLLGFIIVLLFGCKTVEDPRPSPKGFESASEGGQIPYKVVKDASSRYGGALSQESQDSSTQSGNGSQTRIDPQRDPDKPPRPKGITVALGSLAAQEGVNEPRGSDEEIQQVRKIIEQGLKGHSEVTLIDSPAAQKADDEPMPGLAGQGVRFVIKGSVSHNKETGNVTVFLRIVTTSEGKICGVASGRGKSLDQAAGDATKRVLRKLEDQN